MVRFGFDICHQCTEDILRNTVYTVLWSNNQQHVCWLLWVSLFGDQVLGTVRCCWCSGALQQILSGNKMCSPNATYIYIRLQKKQKRKGGVKRGQRSHSNAGGRSRTWWKDWSCPYKFILSKSVINCSTRRLTQMAQAPLFFNHPLLRHTDTQNGSTKWRLALQHSNSLVFQMRNIFRKTNTSVPAAISVRSLC